MCFLPELSRFGFDIKCLFHLESSGGGCETENATVHRYPFSACSNRTSGHRPHSSTPSLWAACGPGGWWPGAGQGGVSRSDRPHMAGPLSSPAAGQDESQQLPGVALWVDMGRSGLLALNYSPPHIHHEREINLYSVQTTLGLGVHFSGYV